MAGTDFQPKTLSLAGQVFPYAVRLPEGNPPEDGWPVILFLHGAAERGDDGRRQTTVGLGPVLVAKPDAFPAIVVLPQCPRGTGWIGPAADAALLALDETVEEHQGDETRLYVTGVSMGGFGSFLLASENPGHFAAMVPVCGGGDPESMAEPLRDLPIWVFHGAADDVVSVDRSREMVDAIKAAGSTTVRYTEYRGVGHNSWDMAYNEPELPRWLLAQSKKV
jgi:predicted peptidase